MMFATALQLLIDKHNYSIARLSREVNISRSHIYRLLNGEINPSLATIERLCSAFDIAPHQLVKLTESVKEKSFQ
jgi:transcriptional regulator with XRE-family HTH domain